MNRPLVIIAFGALGALGALAGCSSRAATPEPAPASALAPVPHAAPHDASADADVGRLAGKPLYLALCAPCHGADAKGYAADHAPSLVSSTFLESASDDFLRQSIIAGRPGTSMAAYGKASGGPLDDAGVDRLVAFLARARSGAKAPARDRGGRRQGRRSDLRQALPRVPR